jgi:CubicO group peptidase (beta-lactamase class C family)
MLLLYSASVRADDQTVPASEPTIQAALAQLDTLAARVIMEGGVPGLAIAVVYRDEVVYLKGFGVREAGKSDPVTPDTVFQLASMSKPISATIVAGLVSKGAVSWDDPLVKHMPEFALYDPYVTREVTIRDMFSHRSGLSGAAGNDIEELGYDRAEILRRLRYLKPASSFRSQYAYSNFGLTAGGLAAARAVGRTWEEAAAETLFKPLGMSAITPGRKTALCSIFLRMEWQVSPGPGFPGLPVNRTPKRLPVELSLPLEIWRSGCDSNWVTGSLTESN